MRKPRPNTHADSSTERSETARTSLSIDSSRKAEPLWPSLNRRESLMLAILILLGVVWLVFHKLVQYDFVNLDDNLHVYENPYLHTFGLSEIGHFWKHPYGQLYIPISYTVFALLTFAARRAAGSQALSDTGANLDPHVFHLANLILHAVNVILVFLVLRRLTRKEAASLVGALLFAIHPLQVESVAWVSELRGLLGASFGLIAIHLYLAFVQFYESHKRIAAGAALLASVFTSACAMLCKPTYAVLGLVIAALALLGCGRDWKKVVREAALYFPAGIALLLVTAHVQAKPAGEVIALPLRPFIAGDTLAFYLWKFTLPFGLTFDYGRKPTWVLSHWCTYVEWIVPLIVSDFAVKAQRTAPYLGFGLLVSLFMILPVLGLTPFVFQSISTTADRYLYFAMLGPAIIVAFWLSSLESARRSTAFLGAAVWLCALGVSSSVQTLAWRNSASLMTHAISVNPRSALAENNLAEAFDRRGEVESALKHELRATTLDPNSPMYEENAGREYVALGLDNAAEARFRQGLVISPNATSLHLDYGMLLMVEQKPREAIVELNRALQLDPSCYRADEWLGDYYFRSHNYGSAVASFADAARHRPDIGELWRKLGIALSASGQAGEAVLSLQRAVKLDPNDLLAVSVLRSMHTRSSTPLAD